MPVIYPDELQQKDLVLEFVEYAPHRFLGVPTYHFHMIDPESSAVIGRINLRDAQTPLIDKFAGHLGYEVAEQARGKRTAVRAIRMLLPLARRLGLDPLWITCDPENLASRRTCELIGATYVETVEVPGGSLLWLGGARLEARFRLDNPGRH
jgi:predicted acetyltransferase